MSEPETKGESWEPSADTGPDPAKLAEDMALLARLRAGEEAAYERLVRESGGRMLKVARRFLKSDEDARDAVQEAFFSAFRSIERFDGDGLIATWLHRIVVNACLMKLRSAKRRPEESIEEYLPAFTEDGRIAKSASEWSDAADIAIEREEVRLLVRQAIDRLPESYRTVLLLREIEGLDTEEVARLLEITPNAVKVRLHRARQAIRGQLDPSLRRRTP
jgi:RNA polymerase sigma-70 factor (ECF subfamily)